MKTRKTRKPRKPQIQIHANCVAREHIDDETLQALAELMLRFARDLECGGRGNGLWPPRSPGSKAPCYVQSTEARETKKEFHIAIRADGDDVHFFIDDRFDRLGHTLLTTFGFPIHLPTEPKT